MKEVKPDGRGMLNNWWGRHLIGDDEFSICAPPVTIRLRIDRSQRMIVIDRTYPGGEDTSRYVLPSETNDDGELLPEAQNKDWEFELRPALADRPVVTRPSVPLILAADTEIKLHFSTPLWIAIHTVHPPQLLTEFPLARPSDTWFGPSTIEGELCYAALSYGTVQLDDLPGLPEKAATSVIIRNYTKTELPIERVLVPVPHLSLYRTGDGRMWTDNVILERKSDSDLAQLVTRNAETSNAEWTHTATRLSGPRVKPSKMIRAFDSLLAVWGPQ